MAKRNFLPTGIRIDGQSRNVYRFVCSRCPGPTEPIICTALSGKWPNSMVVHVASRKGWTIGKKEGSDVCPACCTAERSDRTVRTIMADAQRGAAHQGVIMGKTNQLQLVAATSVTAEPPRAASITDTLIILGRLEEVFEPTKGYGVGITDATLAKELGCPQAWVAEVRRGKYGAVGTNPDISDFISRVSLIRQQIEALCEENGRLRAMLQDLNAKTTKAEGDLKTLIRQSQDIEKTIR